MRRYETIFILRPDLGENQISQATKRIEDVISNGGGEMIEREDWGVRELAYRIGREGRGYYVRLDYVASGPTMNEVERNLKLMDEVLRYLSVMVQKEADAAALRSELEARQRRLAEAKATDSQAEPAKTEAAPGESLEETSEPGAAATEGTEGQLEPDGDADHVEHRETGNERR